jgi:sugar phosphate isomerase/epimerase
MVSDSLANLPFEAMLDAAAGAGVEGIEVTTGNWSSAPHLDLDGLLADAGARTRYLEAFQRRGLALSALNCNGNTLHPVTGGAHDRVVRDTIRLSGLLGLSTVVLMSGLPGGGPGDLTPNWIVSSWPPETASILEWQWEQRLLPYWRELVRFGAGHGVTRFALELHGNQLVYNVPTLLKLRRAIGPEVGANLDPSHLLWMGADPLAAAGALGACIFNVHAKDTFINAARTATVSRLENGPLEDVAARAWSYITLGYGMDEPWWGRFAYQLRLSGYDGWMAIEHEDMQLGRTEGVAKSVALLRRVLPREAPDYATQGVEG